MPRQNVSLGVSDQARHKPACAATEASWSLEISALESRDIVLSKQQTTKVLVRLRECAGWSAPLLLAYDIRHIFLWPGSIVLLYSIIINLGHHFLFFWFTNSADPNFSKTGIKIELLLLIIIFIFFDDPGVLVMQKKKKKIYFLH